MTNRKMLLIEDSEDDQALILRALKKAGVESEIDVIHDGAEALEYIFGRERHEGRGVAHPTITILDLKLPKVDGLEVLRQIREDARTKNNPVVILTSSAEHDDLIRGYGLGVNSYVRKPIEFAQFSKTVADLGLYWLQLNQVSPDAQ
jgi:CheY-like chemotaxis protein